MAPESPSWQACSEMRQSCQNAIFEKLDEQHSETMEAITSIKETVAGIKGERRAEAKASSTAERPAIVRGLTGRELVLIIGAVGALVTSVIVAMATRGGG